MDKFVLFLRCLYIYNLICFLQTADCEILCKLLGHSGTGQTGILIIILVNVLAKCKDIYVIALLALC